MMSLATLDDAALLEKLSRGSEEAVSVLYDRYGRIVFAVALRLVGDREAAEEITQDVFTSVWKKVHTYRADQGKVATWISRITRNRAIDELRRRGARPEQRSVRRENGVGEDPAWEENPADQAELALRRQRVRAALTSLPAEQKEALALAYFQGWSHSEISEALGQPLGTVKTRIRLGMQKLQRLLGTEAEEPE
jgi:RNA polymerase sigma-70 factor (ECF subfamily)